MAIGHGVAFGAVRPWIVYSELEARQRPVQSNCIAVWLALGSHQVAEWHRLRTKPQPIWVPLGRPATAQAEAQV